jgi:5-methylthioadenosine/S-adenosylhomocysteine deaminase
MRREDASCDLLLEGGVVLTVDDDRRVLDPGSVAVSGNRIVAVGPAEELRGTTAGRTVDCRGKAILPGFVDCHQHLFHTLGRGLGEGMELWDWLSKFLWPLSETIDREEARVAVTLAAVESARAGITTVTDNHYAPVDPETTLAVADAVERVGLRGVIARGMFGETTEIAIAGGLGGDVFRYSNAEEIDIARDCMRARRPEDHRVVVWPCPENIIYNDQELVRRAVELAREFGVGWHTHCSEIKTDPGYYERYYGIRPVDWLYEEGLLGQGATLAHGIYFTDREVERVGETQTGIAYCPVSHQYFGLGVMRLRALREAGGVVGLGTDGNSASQRLDMFEQMKQAILLQRVHAVDPAVSNGEEAFELATREGARYLGIDAGELAPGKLADIAVVDLDAPHFRPLHRVLPALVYCAGASDVWMTIVDGEVVFEDGRCPNVDEAALMDEVQERAEQLVARAGLEGLAIPWRLPSAVRREPSA